MSFALARAIEDLEIRLGPNTDAAASNWRYGNLFSIKFNHAPFSETPLKSLYGVSIEGQGNHRTLNMSWARPQSKDGPFVAIAGPIYRQVIDMNEPTSLYIMQDLGISQNIGDMHWDSSKEDFSQGKYFRMATKELAE